MQDLDTWPWMEMQVAQTLELWNECAGSAWHDGRRYSQTEQRERERAYDESLRTVEREARRTPRSVSERIEAQKRVIAAFAQFSAAALDLKPEAIHLLTGGFVPAGTRLARWAKRFDPNLRMEEIVQACRNAWTACGMQPLLGERMELTPAILGYSLLYPYSDNYLDREDVSADEKLRFSERFRGRLRGERLLARNEREAALWKLVALIEAQYSRCDFPEVFDCLLAIHEAQERSIAQLAAGQLSDGEILRTTFAKGGSSVLADACLARGWLKEDETRFSFQWGVLLQLGDDLQDLHDDMLRGSATVFSMAAKRGVALDRLTMQLLNFGERVTAGLDVLPSGDVILKGLLRMSWRLLILGAVANAHKFFSASFLREAELYSPFQFDFLRARKRRMTKRQNLYAALFPAFLEGPEGDDDAALWNAWSRERNPNKFHPDTLQIAI